MSHVVGHMHSSSGHRMVVNIIGAAICAIWLAKGYIVSGANDLESFQATGSRAGQISLEYVTIFGGRQLDENNEGMNNQNIK